MKEVHKCINTLPFDEIVRYLDLSPKRTMPLIKIVYETFGPLGGQQKQKIIVDEFTKLYQRRHAGGGTTRRHKKYNRRTRRLH